MPITKEETENRHYSLLKITRVRELFPDAQIGPDALRAFEDALYILLMKANDRRLVNKRTRFFPCDV